MFVLFVCAIGSGPVYALTAALTPSFNPPGLVGQTVTWYASTDSENMSSMRYRFTARLETNTSGFEVIRDFSPDSALDWTASEREGVYLIEVVAVDLSTGDSASAHERFRINSRIFGRQPQAFPTGNPLVFLFTAPSCQSGSRMRVEFAPARPGGAAQATSFKDCRGFASMNFYLAGLQPQTPYTAHAVVDDGSALTSSAAVTFTSGDGPSIPEAMTVLRPAPPGATQQVLLTSNGFAADLTGMPIWGGAAPVNILTRAEAGGFFWGIVEDSNFDIGHQAIRKFDLTGMILRETNAEQVNRQLAAMGKRTISSFHHEARPLPDGRVVALATVEQIVTNTQGPGDVNVLGDMIVVFDSNLNVVWTWDTFDWLDVHRAAILSEVCAQGGGGGCPPFYLTANANDWTHGNAVQLTPDGALLYSARHQDWLIKIDYANGEGDGHIIWKLGRGGDFTMLSSDPSPWFSHQHDGNFTSDNPSELLVFDNGNTRWRETGEALSRGQSILLDEANRTATLHVNANLGVLSAAVGSAQKLLNGNYHFDAGYVIQPNNSLAAFQFEADKAGRIVFELVTPGLVYRSFRMADLYTP